ncbi:hypothetical protein BYT27DRAFT_7220575 [Phlegmacium glaucopus]|nr:hypothetical protein BYT27DRAFT_7220575 [Phlegmacium glaucopus]
MVPPSSPLPAPEQHNPKLKKPAPKLKQTYHPFISGRPCNENGEFLPEGTLLPYQTKKECDDWTPFENVLQFKVADFLYRQEEMSQGNINHLLELWGLLLMKHGSSGPFENYKHIYDTIDAIEEGDAPWQCFKSSFDEVDDDVPNWRRQEYKIWYRDPEVVAQNMLANLDFDNEFDPAPYVEIDKDGRRRWADFMSANYAWHHCGAMCVPIILGSDKTTVSVGTGDIEYHPLYFSIGMVHNSVRRAHHNAVHLTYVFDDCKYDNDLKFHQFKHQLYHSSISAIFSTLKPAMKTPTIYRCPDGHFHRVIFDLGPFIADYPEQVMLASVLQNWCPHCTSLPSDIDGMAATFDVTTLRDEYGIDALVVPFTHDFPRADIYELISSDLLHQAIKGTFKDHLVAWVGEYLEAIYETAKANRLMDEIDRRLAAVPRFPGLRRFKQGRRFKQWTGDDSKALMKVYLPAIHGLVPPEVVKSLSAFLDFCYIARHADFDNTVLQSLDAALCRFHIYREIFQASGVRDRFSLPHQHSLVHYRLNTQEFGAPGGLCLSITESRHIMAVKKPWQRSSRYEALGQMLITIQCLNKLNAARANYISCGMLPPEHQIPTGIDDEDNDGGPTDEQVMADVKLAQIKCMSPILILFYVFLTQFLERKYPSALSSLAIYIEEPRFPSLVCEFLHQQLNISGDEASTSEFDLDMPDDDILEMISPISVFHSAVATFYAPSDISGIRGMRHKHIRSTPSWHATGPQRDCVFVVENEDNPGFRGMSVVQVKLLFSFHYKGEEYLCALVEWFKKIGRSPEEQTGMWAVKPEVDESGKRLTSVVHIDTILRGAHLLPVYGKQFLPLRFRHTWSLDCFKSFFINKYADHHANEIAF